MTHEPVALDIDWDLILHLGIPDSVRVFQAEQVKSDVIEDPQARGIFAWQMNHIKKYKEPASASVLENEYPDIALERPETSVEDLISRLRQRYMRNEGRQMISKIAHLASEDPLEVAQAMMESGRHLSDITRRRGEIFGPGDFSRAMQHYHERVTRGKGPTLGFPELDEHFDGITNLGFLIGTPKSGKSWFAVNTAYKNIKVGAKPYHYSLELPAVDTEWRLACMVAKVPFWKYLKRKLTEKDRAKLMDAMDEVRTEGYIEKPAPGSRTVHHMVNRALELGADCIIIDQLQYMENRNGNSLGAANNTGDYWEVCQDLRDYSDQIPILVVHQFNRSAMSAKGELPEMQQIKGSAAIEETGTLLLALHATKEQRKSGIIEVGTLASRNYTHKAWTMGMQLSNSCEINMIGEVEEDEEDEDE